MKQYGTTWKAALWGSTMVFWLSAWAAGDDCQSIYNGNTGALDLVCVQSEQEGAATGLVGGMLKYRGENVFELTRTWIYDIADARVSDVRVANGDIPVVLVTAILLDGCVYSTPLIDTTVSGFDIRMKVQVFSLVAPAGEEPSFCTMGNRTLVFPVALNGRSLRTGTYTVTANGVSGMFDYKSPGISPETVIPVI